MVIINGQAYPGNNLSINNGKIIIDGVDMTPDAKQIIIEVSGGVQTIMADVVQKITVTGDVGAIKTLSGDVDVSGTVSGSIQTMSGDVDCGSVGGSVSTMSGDVKHRK